VRTALPANREEYRDLRLLEMESKGNSRKFRVFSNKWKHYETGNFFAIHENP
jgi:hypothetical protein